MISSFASLNIVQFFSALNDNIFKLLMVFLLINIMGPEESNFILASAGFIFVIPFLIFASPAGIIADRFSKRNVIVFTRFLEVIVMALAILVVAFQWVVGCYLILFLMATNSAIFSPCKFGILPEIVQKEKLSHYNGLLSATTYFAIIVGTFFASLLTQVTKRNFVLSSAVCLVIVSLGALFSLGVKKTKAMAAEKKVTVKVITDIYHSLKKAGKIRYLLIVLIFSGYFLFIGAYVQLNIIPYAMQSLKLTEIQGGYLFLMTALGIGIGSFLAGKLSGKEVELGYVPGAAFGISIVLILLYFFSAYFYAAASLLILLGIFGGFYIIPMEAFIQAASLSEDRGQNIATANFISFLGVVLASILLALFGVYLKLTAAVGFLIVGILTIVMGFFLTLSFGDQVLRLLISRLSDYFWDLKVIGRKNVRQKGPLLLVAKRETWIDTIIVMATLPRLIRYIVPIQGRFMRPRSFVYKLLKIMALDREHFVTLGPKAIDLIHRELSLGHSVCLMQPPLKEIKNIKEWEEDVSSLVEGHHIPVLPIYIGRKPPQKGSYIQQFFALFHHPIRVSYGSLHSEIKK